MPGQDMESLAAMDFAHISPNHSVGVRRAWNVIVSRISLSYLLFFSRDTSLGIGLVMGKAAGAISHLIWTPRNWDSGHCSL